MIRTASAVWQGGLKDGNGSLSTQSGVLKDTQYGFKSRFEDGIGTNPEELLAAAHAGCFTMALSNVLGQAGLTAEKLETTASLTFEPVDGKPTVKSIALKTVAKIPNADKAVFEKAAHDAKDGCPVTRLFKGNAEITLDASLV